MALINVKSKRTNYTREIDEKIVQMRNEGKSVKEIAKATNRSLASITYRINKVLKVVNDYKDIKYKDESLS